MNRIKTILEEICYGLKQTKPYLLSHHSKYSRKCYTLAKRNIRVCSRCAGIWTGIITAIFVISIFQTPVSTHYIYSAVAVAPSLTLFDWILTRFTGYEGHNYVRTFLGILLGASYVFGAYAFITHFPDIFILLVFVAYLSLASFFLYFS